MTRPPVRSTVALVVALVVVACSSADHSVSQRPNGSATNPRTGSPSSSPGSLDWRRCDGDFECATLRVPLDPDRPNGRTIDIAMVRHRASDAGERIGSLVMNPGGPGGSGIAFVEGVMETLDPSVRDRFDIVGFDPRGVGRSAALDCAGEEEMYRIDPTLDGAGDRNALLDSSRSFVADCRARYGDVLPYLGTREVARDMERMRVALGDEQLTFVGLSYGTAIGQVYADLFPKRMRAMVLDGVVDLTASGVASATAQAVGFERALMNFAISCRRDPSCPIAQDPIGAVDRVIASAERAPLPASREGQRVGPGEMALALAEAMYSPSSWSGFAEAVAGALTGDAADLADLAERYLAKASIEIYFAVSCLDSSWPDADELLNAAQDAGRLAPHFGEALVNDYVRCSLWPAPPRPLQPPTATGAPPILVVSTTNDPATPHAAGVALAKRLDSAVLLSRVGDGHTAAFAGDPCIDDAVTTYLVSLRPPRNGTTC